jgi:hypothetical protein
MRLVATPGVRVGGFDGSPPTSGPCLRRGAVVVDRHDSAIEPYVVCLLEHDVTDGRSGTTGKPQIVSRRVQYVRADLAASALDEAGEPGGIRLGSQRKFHAKSAADNRLPIGRLAVT